MAATEIATAFDSILIVAFGGPTSGDQGYDYVKGIVGDRPAAEARIRDVARHYEQLNGSPFNSLTFEQAEAVKAELELRGIEVPIHTGMRHWDPYVKDVMKEMADSGLQNTMVVIMAPHQCFVSWDWYQSTVAEGNEALGKNTMTITYPDPWWNAPEYIQANVDNLQAVFSSLDDKASEAKLIFSVHSIPISSCPPCRAGERECPYTDQFKESAQLVADALGRGEDFEICYQSQHEFSRVWTKPDVNELLRKCKEEGVKDVVISPIGFLVDHVEVLWDLDVEAKETCEECGIGYHRSETVGTHPEFIKLIGDRIEARFQNQTRISAPLS